MRATEAQVRYLVSLGMERAQAMALDKWRASREITLMASGKKIARHAGRIKKPAPEEVIDSLYCTLPPHDVDLIAVSRKNRVVAMLATIADILSKDRNGQPIEFHEAALWAVTIALDHANRR